MAGDWIKLHRKLLTSAVFQNSRCLHVWIWCLLSARHQDGWADIHMELPRGSFACGTISAANELGMSRSAFVRALDKLEECGMIARKADSKRTRITVCNYTTYQSSDNSDRTTSGQLADSDRTTSGQLADTKEERKKERRVRKKEISARSFAIPTPEEISEYSQSIGYPLDGQAWCDSYEQKGWMVGKNRMKSWKAAVRTWKTNGYQFNGRQVAVDQGKADSDAAFAAAAERRKQREAEANGRQ